MPSAIKAIVFKTTQLKATRQFFESILNIQIKEGYARHFVIYSKNIRIVFVESFSDFEVEIYVKDKSNHLPKEIEPGTPGPDFKSCKDPNGIRIVIT
jgi:hypothetical protein